jgi:hypothetical protein
VPPDRNFGPQGGFQQERGNSAMIKVKSFSSQLKIFHTRQELDERLHRIPGDPESNLPQ